MKRIVVVLYLFSTALLYCVDFGVDFTQLDPKAFLSNMDNEYKDGYVITTGKVTYYRKLISYTIGCNKENINNFYVYYTFSLGDQEIFLSFFKDFFNHYSEKAIRLVAKSINTNYGHEMQYEISIPDLPSYLIYVQSSYVSGMLGFGITYASSYNYKFDNNIKSLATTWNNPNIIEYKYRFVLEDIVSNICYYKDIEFLENDVLMIDKDKIDGWEDYYFAIDASIIRKKANATMYILRLIIDDDNIKNDPRFLSYNLIVDYNTIIPFYDLLSNDVYKIYGNKYSIFRIDINTTTKEEIIELSK